MVMCSTFCIHADSRPNQPCRMPVRRTSDQHLEHAANRRPQREPKPGMKVSYAVLLLEFPSKSGHEHVARELWRALAAQASTCAGIEDPKAKICCKQTTEHNKPYAQSRNTRQGIVVGRLPLETGLLQSEETSLALQ